jgi:hypothetical protein
MGMSSKPPRWEYLVRAPRIPVDTTDDDRYKAELRALGEEGWELVAVSVMRFPVSGEHIVQHFKRPLPDEEQP